MLSLITSFHIVLCMVPFRLCSIALWLCHHYHHHHITAFKLIYCSNTVVSASERYFLFLETKEMVSLPVSLTDTIIQTHSLKLTHTCTHRNSVQELHSTVGHFYLDMCNSVTKNHKWCSFDSIDLPLCSNGICFQACTVKLFDMTDVLCRGNGEVEKQLQLNRYRGMWPNLLLLREWKAVRDGKGRKGDRLRLKKRKNILEECCKSARWERPTLVSGHLWHSHLNRLLQHLHRGQWGKTDGKQSEYGREKILLSFNQTSNTVSLSSLSLPDHG